MANVTLHLGDCLDVLRGLDAASVDAVCTDPPAGIAFMNKEWDTFPLAARERPGAAPHPAWRGAGDGYNGVPTTAKHRAGFVAFLTAVMAECFRVAKPGAYALVWALPRTSHWTGTAVEDAGWVIQDRISHLFGQGFPKHRSKLKPACEDWWLAWKPDRRATPLPGLDGCRIGTEGTLRRATGARDGIALNCAGDGLLSTPRVNGNASGRWPANVVLSHTPECVCVGTRKVKAAGWRECGNGGGVMEQQGVDKYPGRAGRQDAGKPIGYADADGMEEAECWECSEDCPVRLLDEQSGDRSSRDGTKGNRFGRFGNGACYGKADGADKPAAVYGDTGGASRFFYCAKASRKDRGPGNTHPTVKPQALMRWLCRLITPPGGTILDPFAGSGTTLLAALAEGFVAVGIEQNPEYHAIARRRLAAAQPHLAFQESPEQTALRQQVLLMEEEAAFQLREAHV